VCVLPSGGQLAFLAALGRILSCTSLPCGSAGCISRTHPLSLSSPFPLASLLCSRRARDHSKRRQHEPTSTTGFGISGPRHGPRHALRAWIGSARHRRVDQSRRATPPPPPLSVATVHAMRSAHGSARHRRVDTIWQPTGLEQLAVYLALNSAPTLRPLYNEGRGLFNDGMNLPNFVVFRGDCTGGGSSTGRDAAFCSISLSICDES